MLFRLGSFSGPLVLNEYNIEHIDEDKNTYIWFTVRLVDLSKLYSPGLSSTSLCKFQRKHSYLSELKPRSQEDPERTGDCPQWRDWETSGDELRRHGASAACPLTAQEIKCQRGQ